MELSDYLRIFRQRGWIILLLVGLTAVAAYAYSSVQTPIYRSVNRLLITSRPDAGQTQATKVLVIDYADWLNSRRRADAVINELQLDMVAGELMGDVKIAAAAGKNIIEIEVENSNPDLANDIARVWGDQLVRWRNDQNAGLRKEDRIGAEPIDDPISGLESPKTKINTLAGGVLGALLGIIVIFLLEWIESGVVRRGDDVERYLDIPVIGSIPSK